MLDGLAEFWRSASPTDYWAALALWALISGLGILFNINNRQPAPGDRAEPRARAG